MADFLEEERQTVEAPLKELKPARRGVQPPAGRRRGPRRARQRLRHSGRPPRPPSPRRPPVARAAPPAAAPASAAAPRAVGPGAAQALRAGHRPSGHHHPRDGRGDGHPAELPLPRDARPGGKGSGHQVRPRLAPTPKPVKAGSPSAPPRSSDLNGARGESPCGDSHHLPRRGRAWRPPRAPPGARRPSCRCARVRTRARRGPARSSTHRSSS